MDAQERFAAALRRQLRGEDEPDDGDGEPVPRTSEWLMNDVIRRATGRGEHEGDGDGDA